MKHSHVPVFGGLLAPESSEVFQKGSLLDRVYLQPMNFLVYKYVHYVMHVSVRTNTMDLNALSNLGFLIKSGRCFAGHLKSSSVDLF